jgi:hypothetical protein
MKNPLDFGALRTTLVTATAASGAATAQGELVRVTSESLSTAAATTYVLTITNARVTAASTCFASVKWGTSSAGTPAVARVTPAAGSVVVEIQNIHSANALNGTIVVDVLTINPA